MLEFEENITLQRYHPATLNSQWLKKMVRVVSNLAFLFYKTEL